MHVVFRATGRSERGQQRRACTSSWAIAIENTFYSMENTFYGEHILSMENTFYGEHIPWTRTSH